MSDVRPELQQIREALELASELPLSVPGAHIQGLRRLDALVVPGRRSSPAPALAALARVEATLNGLTTERDEAHVRLLGRLEDFEAQRKRAEAAEARVVAAEAERDEARANALIQATAAGQEAWREQKTRAVAAEAERDALVAALEVIAAGRWNVGTPSMSAMKYAQKALASVRVPAAPAEPPRDDTELISRESWAQAERAFNQPLPVPAEPPREESGRFADGGSVEFTLTPDGWVETARTERAEPPRPANPVIPVGGKAFPAPPAPAEPPREPRRCDKSFGDRCRLPHGHTGDHVTAAGARWYALDATPAAPAEPPREEVSEPESSSGCGEDGPGPSAASSPGSLTSPAPAEPPREEVSEPGAASMLTRPGGSAAAGPSVRAATGTPSGSLTSLAPAEPPREAWKCEACGWTNLGYVAACDGCGASPAPAEPPERPETP